jgi:hypothetical protein
MKQTTSPTTMQSYGIVNCSIQCQMVNIARWHADVKPDNILSVRGSFVLADFGFARFQKKSTKSHDEPAFQTLTGGTDTYG